MRTGQTGTASVGGSSSKLINYKSGCMFTDLEVPFIHPPLFLSFCFLLKANSSTVIRGPISCITSNPAGGPNLLPSHATGCSPSSCFSLASPNPEAGWQEENQSSGAQQGALGDSRQEVQDLKEQLEALRCQVGCSLQRSNEKCSHF